MALASRLLPLMLAAAAAAASAQGAVTVVGDSFADSGTFGRRITIGAASARTFADLLALQRGAELCSAFQSDGVSSPKRKEGHCRNFAVAGSRINFYADVESPLSLPEQLQAAYAAAQTAADDLLIVNGGINDVAFLVGSLQGLTPGERPFPQMLATLLPAATVEAAVAAGPSGAASAGLAYMEALADRLHDALRGTAMKQGAQRVVIVNLPDLTQTPLFDAALKGMASASEGGAKAAARSATMVRAWVAAYNARLAKHFAGDRRVIVFDYHTELERQLAQPALYGLGDVRTPVCPRTGLAPTGLPRYDLSSCTEERLTGLMPAAPHAWRVFLWADDLHPTPYAHLLIAQAVARAMAAMGWR